MKKKIFCLFAVVLFGMLVLCSCGGGEEYPFMISAKECWYDGYVYSMNTRGILTYRRANETEGLPLCFDPLCEHGEDCLANAHIANQAMLVTRNRDGEICVYYAERVVLTGDVADGVSRLQYRLCCINTQTSEKRIILDGQSESITMFCLYGNDIYLLMQKAAKNEEGKTVYQSDFSKMSLNGGELTELSTTEFTISDILGMAEVKGELTVYWADAGTLYVSPADFSRRTKLADRVNGNGSFVEGDYLYYAAESETVYPEMRVPAHTLGSSQYTGATHVLYSEAQLTAYYRLDMTDSAAATPELVYDGVWRPDILGRPVWINGDKLYAIPYAPVYFEALDAYAVVDYVNTEKNPDKIPLQYEYISARSGEKIVEVDLSTGEQREISTPGFDPERIMGGNDGSIVVRGNVVDIERIRGRIRDLTAETGSMPLKDTYMFWEIQEIPLNP